MIYLEESISKNISPPRKLGGPEHWTRAHSSWYFHCVLHLCIIGVTMDLVSNPAFPIFSDQLQSEMDTLPHCQEWLKPRNECKKMLSIRGQHSNALLPISTAWNTFAGSVLFIGSTYFYPYKRKILCLMNVLPTGTVGRAMDEDMVCGQKGYSPQTPTFSGFHSVDLPKWALLICFGNMFHTRIWGVKIERLWWLCF